MFFFASPRHVLTSSLARPRLQSVLNVSLRCYDIIQVHIQDINKSILCGFLSLEKIDSVRQVCEKKSRLQNTHNC